ncbi:hypothetical protein ACT7DL_32775 [Bacillus paranthracis]
MYILWCSCSFEVWTKGRKILKVQPSSDAPVNAISTRVKENLVGILVNSKRTNYETFNS